MSPSKQGLEFHFPAPAGAGAGAGGPATGREVWGKGISEPGGDRGAGPGRGLPLPLRGPPARKGLVATARPSPPPVAPRRGSAGPATPLTENGAHYLCPGMFPVCGYSRLCAHTRTNMCVSLCIPTCPHVSTSALSFTCAYGCLCVPTRVPLCACVPTCVSTRVCQHLSAWRRARGTQLGAVAVREGLPLGPSPSCRRHGCGSRSAWEQSWGLLTSAWPSPAWGRGPCRVDIGFCLCVSRAFVWVRPSVWI